MRGMSLATNQPPLPPSGQYIESIRSSCRALRIDADISITEDAIRRLLLSPAFMTTIDRLKHMHGVSFPLKFSSQLAEVNFLSVLALLNFGSGYRVPLHLATGKGAYDNVRALMFSMFLASSDESAQGNLLSAQGMHAITDARVGELMQVSLHVEKPHPSIPGVIVGELGGPVYEFVQLVTRTLNETGEVLLRSGYPDLGSFVLQALLEAEKDGRNGLADPEVALEHVIRAIPSFQDMAIVNGQPVYVFKRVLFLLNALALRFPQSGNPLPHLPVVDTSSLPVYSDNVLPSILVHLGVIDLSQVSHVHPGLMKAFPSTALPSYFAIPSDNDRQAQKAPPLDGPHLTSDEAFVLRAAAIDACELIVEVAHALARENSDYTHLAVLTLPDIDGWLWSVAKDRSDYRRLTRFVNRNTVFF